mgnify:CR=1 FL=1
MEKNPLSIAQRIAIYTKVRDYCLESTVEIFINGYVKVLAIRLGIRESEKIECIRYLEFGKKIKMVETDVQGIEIDTPEDLERAKHLWKNN